MANTKITADNLAANAVNASSIADGVITPAKIASGDFYFDTNTLYVDSANNRVGIGTASPATTLGINGATQILAGNALYFQNSAADANGTISGSGGAGENTLSFNSGAMVLNASGNLGIGTTPPAGVRTKIKGLAEATNLATSATSAALFIEPYSGSSWGLGIGSVSGQKQYIQGVSAAGDSSRELLINPYGANVGIGTTSATSTLSISGPNSGSTPVVDIVASGTGTFQRGVRMLNSGMASGDHIMYALGRSDNARNMGQTYFYYYGDASTSNRISMGLHSVDDVFNILGTGNVGIGTSSPDSKLEVAGTAFAFNSTNNRPAVIVSGSYGGALGFEDSKEAGFYAQDSGDTFNLYVGRTIGTDTPVSKVVQTWKYSGNVGIGHDSPQFRLTIPQASDDSGKIGWEDGANNKRASILCNSTNDRLEINTGTADTLRMSFHGSNANVHVGENASDIQLLIGSQGGAYGGNSSHWMRAAGNTLMWNAGGASGTYAWEINGSAVGRVLSTGEWVIGSSQSDTISTDRVNQIGSLSRTVLQNNTGRLARLVIQERQGNWISFCNGSSDHYGTISQSGSGVNYGSNSDYRLKENVIELENALTRVMNLKPKRFNFITSPDITQDGFLAHEVEEIVPEAVSGQKDGVSISGNIINSQTNEIIKLNVDLPDVLEEGTEFIKVSESEKYQQFDPAKLVPLLTKAIQEQQTIIDDLKARIETLENA